MNIYKVTSHYAGGYDTYDSFICVAADKKEARSLHPASESETERRAIEGYWTKVETQESIAKRENASYTGGWVHAQNVHLLKVEKIGKASASYTQAEIILTSFNAG